MDGVLPPEVQWRLGKANIGAHFLRAMLAQNRGTLDDLFLNHSEVLEEYFDVPALRAAYHRYVAAPMVMSSSDSMYVITAASLGLWLRRFGSAASPQIAEPGLSRT